MFYDLEDDRISVAIILVANDETCLVGVLGLTFSEKEGVGQEPIIPEPDDRIEVTSSNNKQVSSRWSAQNCFSPERNYPNFVGNPSDMGWKPRLNRGIPNVDREGRKLQDPYFGSSGFRVGLRAEGC